MGQFFKTLYRNANNKAVWKPAPLSSTGFAFAKMLCKGFSLPCAHLDPNYTWGITGRRSLPLLYAPLTSRITTA